MSGCIDCNDKLIITTSYATTGPTGAAGAAGARGEYGGYCSDWIFDADSNAPTPADSNIRFNNNTYNLVTEIYIDNLNGDGDDYTGFLAGMINSNAYGNIRIFEETDPTKAWYGEITNVTANGSDYTLEVTYIDNGSGTFATADKAVVCFVPAGVDGTNGANGTNGADGVDGASGGFCTTHTYSSNTIAPPPIGGIEFNAGVPPFNAITGIILHHTNADGEDVQNMLATGFDNGGDFGYVTMYEKSDPTKAWFGEITAVTDFGVSAYVQLLVTYIDDTDFGPSNGEDIVTCFTPAGADGASDGYVWNDYGTTCAAITGFDAALPADKIDILVDHICGLTANFAVAPVVFDATYNIDCADDVTIELPSLYSGIFPASVFNITGGPSNGTATISAGPAPGGGSVLYVPNSGFCDATDTFTFTATDSNPAGGVTTAAGTITINVAAEATAPGTDIVFLELTINTAVVNNITSFDLDIKYGEIGGVSASITDCPYITMRFFEDTVLLPKPAVQYTDTGAAFPSLANTTGVWPDTGWDPATDDLWIDNVLVSTAGSAVYDVGTWGLTSPAFFMSNAEVTGSVTVYIPLEQFS